MVKENTYGTANQPLVTEALASLSSDYADVFIFDADTREVQIVRLSGSARGITPEILREATYAQIVDMYVENNVFRMDRERVRSALEPENILSRLSTSSYFSERYCVQRESRFYDYHLKCAVLGNDPARKHFVVGFARLEYSDHLNEADEPSKVEHFRKRKTVLIVEDNALNREMLEAILESEYDILTAENGAIGLEVLAQNYQDIAAVMLDVNMPVCDGYEFLQRIGIDEVLSQIPVIVCTANNSDDDQIRCLELGASDFVAKPYNPRVVEGRLHSIIRLHESINTLSAVEFDELTGVYTKQAFITYARDFLRNHDTSKNIVVFAAKFENYRLVNTMSGREAGDEVLRYLGQRFYANSENGIVCRYESDTFAAIVSLEEEFSLEHMDNDIDAIMSGMPLPNVELQFGIYQHADTSLTIEGLCDRAFAALQSSEQDPNTTVSLFEGEAHLRMEREQRLEAAFPEALANGEFVVYYQPKCNVQTERVEAAEALVRWINSEGKMISPGAFIPLFERDGLITQVDEHMFRTVCQMQRDRIDRGKNVVPVSVNLSRLNLYRHDIVDLYVGIVHDAGIPFDLVPIELTESVSVSDASVHDGLVRLAQAGFPIHLDDFGSGYSSFASLSTLPISTLKIDKTLMDGCGERSGRIIVNSAINVAKSLDMQVVAEGVEELEQVEYLRTTACDLIQGYYYSPPTTLDHFAEMLDRGYVK